MQRFTLRCGYSPKLTTNFILMRLVFVSETCRCVSMKAESARLMPNPHQSRPFILLCPIHRRTPIQKDMKGVYYATEKNQLKRRVGKSINMRKGQCEYADQQSGVAVKFQTIFFLKLIRWHVSFGNSAVIDGSHQFAIAPCYVKFGRISSANTNINK